MASRALSARLSIAAVSCAGSIIAAETFSSSIASISISSPSVGRSSCAEADDQFVDIGCSRLQRLLPRKRQQMLRQFAAALGRVIDHLGDFQKLRPVGNARAQDFDGSGDDGENIVEVMGDAAGQLTQALPFFARAVAAARLLSPP